MNTIILTRKMRNKKNGIIFSIAHTRVTQKFYQRITTKGCQPECFQMMDSRLRHFLNISQLLRIGHLYLTRKSIFMQ